MCKVRLYQSPIYVLDLSFCLISINEGNHIQKGLRFMLHHAIALIGVHEIGKSMYIHS